MYKSILVPFDNSAHSKKALASAIELARVLDAQVTALSVSDLPDFEDPAYEVAVRLAVMEPPTAEQKSQMQRAYYAAQKDALVKNTAEIVGDFENIQYRATAGKAHVVINEFAESGNYDLIIMGCRGLTALRGALGSVSYAVMRSVDIPVMIVH